MDILWLEPKGMPRDRPFYGWAATLTWKDGRTYLDRQSIRPSAWETRDFIASDFAARFDIPTKAAWRRAYRAGWRVIRVQISPAGEREETAR